MPLARGEAGGGHRPVAVEVDEAHPRRPGAQEVAVAPLQGRAREDRRRARRLGRGEAPGKDLEPRPTVGVVEARLHLLSRQVLDVDGEPVTTVDDLELVGADGGEAVPGEEVRVGSVLGGALLLTRLFGGRPPASRRPRIAWEHVGHLGTALQLTVPADRLDVDWVERWAREHVIGRIPGGQHDPEEGS